jgi:hypothetical protein
VSGLLLSYLSILYSYLPSWAEVRVCGSQEAPREQNPSLEGARPSGPEQFILFCATQEAGKALGTSSGVGRTPD